MTFGGHLEVLRRMLFRILFVVGILAIVVFCCKNITWSILLAPSEYDFTQVSDLDFEVEFIV